MIIDAHHHLWDKSRFNYSWLAQVPDIDRNFLIADYEESIRGTGVVKSVFVQADVDPQFALQETRWVLSLAEAATPIEGVVAWAPVEDPALDDYLEKVGEHPQLKGFRRLIQTEDSDFCTRPEFVAGVRRLAALGYSFDLCIYHPQLTAAIELVRQVPEMSFVLDHVGKPDIAAGTIQPWKEQLLELAAMPNTCCKISGMVTEADPKNWTAQTLRPYIDSAIEAFGFERVMFGSDWPVCLLGASYSQWLETVFAAVEGASEAEREHLFCATAARFYRL